MFLKCRERRKDGKTHRSWSIVESRRYRGGKVAHRHVFYLGEINDSERAAWERTIAVIDERDGEARQMALFPSDRRAPREGVESLQVRLSGMRLEHPRQWGACWLADELWRRLGLDGFFAERLPVSREGTDWEKVVRILAIYRLLSPGSEWRLHRHWFGTTALGDLLDVDGRAVQDDTLYRALDLLLAEKEALFSHLSGRWRDLFGARYEILLYDLTSTYFECNEPAGDGDPRRFGYSRDKRGDCVQVVVALVVTPEGLPLAYEMMPGNTVDNQTLREMLATITRRYGQADRIWVMDRGIPTEEVLAELRKAEMPVRYLVGTPKGRLTRLESALAELPWQDVRSELRVKLLPADGELYVLAESGARKDKEHGMRRRQLKRYWARLGELKDQKQSRDKLLKKLGVAQHTAGRVVEHLVQVDVSETGVLTYHLDREKLRSVRQREGRYLLRTNMTAEDPALIWRCYMQLCHVEEAFRTLKGDLGLRPIFHRNPERIEAHLFVSFLAYCLMTTLRQMLKGSGTGLTPRVVIEKLATLQMLDVRLPTTDGRELLLVRHTEPDRDVAMLLEHLKLVLPPQPPPKITYPAEKQAV
jgi:transposase